MSLRVFVEHCVADRTEKGSFSLRGDGAMYLDFFKQLTTLVSIQLPHVTIESNPEELFETLKSTDSGSEPDIRPSTHMPRIGSFEVYLKMDVLVIDGPTQCSVQRLKLVSSKMKSKRWPKLNGVVESILKTIKNEAQDFVLRSLDNARNYLANQMFHSALGAVTRPRDMSFSCSHCKPKECKCPLGSFGEHWEFAGARELTILPTELLRLGSWKLVRKTLCNLHFIAAKIRACGTRALFEDMNAALALTGQHGSGENVKTSEEKRSSPMPKLINEEQLTRQVAYEIKAHAEFLQRNEETLKAQPPQIYALASRMPLPGLNELKQRFLGALGDLEKQSRKIDADDRDCTTEELLKFAYGVRQCSWAADVGFLQTFSAAEQRWISERNTDLGARLLVQQEWLHKMLYEEGVKCRKMLKLTRNGTLRDLSSETKFLVLSHFVTDAKPDLTLRLALRSETQTELTCEEGFKIVDSVLKELWAAKNLPKVEIMLQKDHQRKVSESESHASYFVTASLSAPPAHSNSLEQAYVYLKDILEHQDEHLCMLLPNRSTLKCIGKGQDVMLLIVFRLPNSLAIDLAELKESVRDDITSSLPFDCPPEAILVVYASRRQALIRVVEDLLPPDGSPDNVANDLLHQSQDGSSALFSDKRTVSHHIIWIGHAPGSSPLRLPGVPFPISFRMAGIRRETKKEELAAFLDLALPALHTLCKKRGLFLSLRTEDDTQCQGEAQETDLRMRVVPDSHGLGLVTPVDILLLKFGEDGEMETRKSNERGQNLSRDWPQRRKEAPSMEAYASSAYNRLENALSALYPEVTESSGVPAHLKESLLQERCFDRLVQEVAATNNGDVRAAVVEEIVREATSTEITAPAVVLLQGAAGSGKSTTLAQVVKRLQGQSDKSSGSFVSYMFKPKGMSLAHVLSYLTCDLWLQLLGGRHMRVRGEKHDCGMADLCDVVHKAADSTVDPLARSYLRVVVVLDGLTHSEQVKVAEGILSRPRLFPIFSCIMSSEQPGPSLEDPAELRKRVRMVTSHLHTRVMPLPPLSEAEAAAVLGARLKAAALSRNEVSTLMGKAEWQTPSYLCGIAAFIRASRGEKRVAILESVPGTRREIFSSLMHDMDVLLGRSHKNLFICQLITLPGILENELQLQLCCGQNCETFPAFGDVIARMQPFLEHFPLWRSGSMMLNHPSCVEVMTRYLIPYMDGFSSDSLNSLVTIVSAQQENPSAPYIDEMQVLLETSSVNEVTVRESSEEIGHHWGELEMTSFVMDRKRYKDWVVLQHKTQAHRQRQAVANRVSQTKYTSWDYTPPRKTIPTDIRVIDGSADWASHILMLDNEIGEVLRMSHMAFTSGPQPPSDDYGESSSFEGPDPAQPRPFSADPRGASSPDRFHPRRPASSASLRAKGRDSWEPKNASTPTRRLFQEEGHEREGGGYGLLPSRDRLQGSPALGLRPGSALSRGRPGSALLRDRPGSALSNDTRGRMGGWFRDGAAVSEYAAGNRFALDETVKPYMTPWKDSKHPQKLEKDWVLFDRHMHKTDRHVRKIGFPRDPEVGSLFVKESTQPNVGERRCQLEVLAEQLLSDVGLDSSAQKGTRGFQEYCDSGRTFGITGEVDGSVMSRTSFSKEYDKAVARERATNERRNAVLGYLRKETKRRLAKQREHEIRHTYTSARELKGSEKREEKRRHFHEQYLALQRRARQDRENFRKHVQASCVKWDAMVEVERKELEKSLREAIASRACFDQYQEEMELEEREAERRKRIKEREQRRLEPKEEPPPTPEQLAAAEERKQRHADYLVKRVGMTLQAEQVGPVTSLRDFGTRIRRESQPNTIMIGSRRGLVKKHRIIRGRLTRDDNGDEHREGDSVVREFFVTQIIPAGKYDRGMEGFAGGYRLKVRYSDLKEKTKGSGADRVVYYEGAVRQKPIRVRVKGSDGYLAEWTEHCVEGSASSFAGIVETGLIVAADFEVHDFVELDGFFPAKKESESFWRPVKDTLEVEFIRS